MSITSSNNLSVNYSLSVNGNTVLGSDSTSTLICNSSSTLNSSLIINGNVTQNSGTFSTSSDNIYLNGDITIANNKKLTTSIGTTTINGLTQANNNIYILYGKSLYITDSTLTNYLRMHHNLTSAYIDYTGGLTFRNSGTTSSLLLNNSNNQGTFYYNLNTNGITNTGSIASTGSISCSSLSNSGSSTLASVSCSSLSNSGSSTLASVSCSSLSNSGSSTLTSVSCSSLSNSGTLTQNSTANINSNLNVTGLPYFYGVSNQTLPTTNTGSNAGLSIYWNTSAGHGNTGFLNYAQGGDGGFGFYAANSGAAPKTLLYLDYTANITGVNNITATGTITVPTISCTSLTSTGTITCVNLTSTGTITFDALVVNGKINNSNYYSLKGSTYKDATLGYVYTYYKYNNTTGSSSSETFSLPITYCKTFKIQYSYDTRNSGTTVYQAYTEYVYIKKTADFSNTWTQFIASQVGNYTSFQPTITTTSTSVTINFPGNSLDGEFIYWNFAIYLI